MTLEPGDKITYRARGKGDLLTAEVVRGPVPQSWGGTKNMAWECRKPSASVRGASRLVDVPLWWIVSKEAGKV